MWLLLYLGPVFLAAAVIYGVLGLEEHMSIAVKLWAFFTFIGIIAKPRTIPEYVMVTGNGILFALGVLAALLGLV
jgi:hypothetical protein